MQDNYYYLCDVEEDVQPQILDDYEQEELFTLEFVQPETAIEEIVNFYDYLEIQPLGNNRFLIDEGQVRDEEALKDINRRIYELGKKLGKPVCATCDAHFLNEEDEINRSLGISECIALPDMELREKTVTLCLRMFNTTDLRRLDVQKRITLGKELRRHYRCSAKQIARIIHLAPQYVKELV